MSPLQNFDYHVPCDDFLLYELGRLIEEDKASFDEAEFRNVIDSGIAEHIERKLDIRAAIALRLRREQSARSGPLLHAIEDIERQVRTFPEIIESYTSYLFLRLEECASMEPDERITRSADVLFESTEDHAAAEAALDVLGSIPSAISARVLTHAISEPILSEELETRAYGQVRAMWPMSRHYILYSLKTHAHEDIPFRWFQLLIDCEEPSAVDRILEEFVVHGGDPDFREDLLALTELLLRAQDPETEDKVVEVLNSGETARAIAEMLEAVLKDPKAQRHKDTTGPWAALERAYAANKKYLKAAGLLDAGKKAEAQQALDELLVADPQYPLALMLKQVI
jgi:tetratricopeptide (TPR) repeat protein